MRTTNRSTKRRRGTARKNNRGCGCAAFLAVIAVIIIVVFSLRGCTDVIKSKLVEISDSVTAQQYPIKYQSYVEKYSRKYDIDKYLVYAVIKTESKFDQYAVSQAGAYGLMQIQEETAADCAKRLGLNVELPDDLYIPDINIHIGTYYLSWLLDRYDGDISLAVAAYNGGIGNVDNWLDDDRYSDGSGGLADIPFPETENYVIGVNSSYEKYKELYD